MHRHSLARLAGLALVPVALTFAGAAPVLAEAVPVGQMALTISASATPDWFDVQLTNLHRGEEMGYYLTGPGQQTFGGNAHSVNGNGDLDFGFKMPRAAQAGVWTITFQGNKGDEVAGSFTAAAQVPDVTLAAMEDQEDAGAMLLITSRRDAFDKSEPISYWLADPSGVIVQSGVVDSTKQGKLDLSLSVGDKARGAYTITAYGWHDDAYGVAPVTIG
jgi:hypothetical protein